MRLIVILTVLFAAAVLSAPAVAHFPGDGVGQPELAAKARMLPTYLRVNAVFGIAPPEGCPATEPHDILSAEWDRWVSEYCYGFRGQEADMILTITRGKRAVVVYQESAAAHGGAWTHRAHGPGYRKWKKGRYRWTVELVDPYGREGHDLTVKGAFRVR